MLFCNLTASTRWSNIWVKAFHTRRDVTRYDATRHDPNQQRTGGPLEARQRPHRRPSGGNLPADRRWNVRWLASGPTVLWPASGGPAGGPLADRFNKISPARWRPAALAKYQRSIGGPSADRSVWWQMAAGTDSTARLYVTAKSTKYSSFKFRIQLLLQHHGSQGWTEWSALKAIAFIL